jgi:pilus assembly protein CpaE
MKIKVVSPNSERAEKVAQIVRGSASGLDVLAATAKPDGLHIAVNGSRPGLLVLDGVDLSGLDAVGRYTQAHPEVETIIISSEQSPAFFLKAMQAGVCDVLSTPADGPALQAAVLRVTRKRKPSAPATQGEVFAFMACKGGSGASFLAANLAHILSARDARTVALLDLDLQFGDALMMLSDQRAVSDVAEVARNINRLDADLLRSAMVHVSSTLSVLPAPQELSQALEVKAAHVEAIIKQARQMFDFVVLDVGRSIDVLSLQALDMATYIFPIVQLSLPQVRDAKRLRALFRSLEYPEQKIHWIVNRYQKGSDITLESLEQTLGTKGIKTIPNHFSSVSASVNQGVPIDKLSRNNPVARGLLELAQSIAPVEGARKETWLSGLFSHA